MKTWQGTLAEAKMPAPVLLIDFETYFDATYHLGKDKSALSTCGYVADPRFEVLGFGMQVLNHRWEQMGPRFIPQSRVRSALDTLAKEFGTALHNVTVVSHNAKFDMLVLAERYGLRPPYTIDTMDLARYYESRMSHKLKDLAPVFGIQDKGDTSQFKGQHFADLDLTAMKEYCLGDVRITAELFKRLLPIIDNPAVELLLMRHTLGLYLRPKCHCDYVLADRIIEDMQAQVDAAVTDVAAWIMSETDSQDVEKQLSGDISFVRLLRAVLPAGESIPVKPGKPSKNMVTLTGGGMIPAFAKDDDGCKAMLNHKNQLVRELMTARLAVSSWPNHIGRVRKIVAQARVSHDRIRVPLVYYGCHTGRWSGDEGVNLGNLGGSGRGKAIGKLIGEVRHIIRAEPGDTFVLCDAAQIEARDLAKYAGQKNLVEGFRARMDIYSDFAADLFQVRVWKPNDEEKKTPEGKRAEIYRGFGKDAILGCGYGMGAAKFYQRCLANEVLRPMFDSGEYDEAFVKRLVKTYRSKYSLIPEFWSAVERAWRVATRYEREETVGRLKFWHDNGTTYMRLPSGRTMMYHHARVCSDDRLCYASGNEHHDLWGGSITENIVQATCRDYLAGWILQIERETCRPVVHHVYDETITMVPEAAAEGYRQQIETIMSSGPEWADDMPFAAESSISPFYKK